MLCNPIGLYPESGVKTHYNPLEAAIRWCGLFWYEEEILATVGSEPWPSTEQCARWPSLHLYLCRIFDGLLHFELYYIRNAAPCREGVHLIASTLNDPKVSIRHIDLRKWMEIYYPGERPDFLFGKGCAPRASGERAYKMLFDLYAKTQELERYKETLVSIHSEQDFAFK
jgi:hypothetical protein